ncbi:DHA2 family efflux MFS transporter permease subunit [candidate division GN15 bacterium]|nr:DHA2 family efflux MFS transporter permease subunit [candidate division GN15 bacterium]
MNIEQIQANRYKFFTVGAIGTFMATLDGSILNVALPSIADDFGASVDVVAWVVLAYSLTLISLMMAFGAWVQRKGYKFAYQFGYTLFLLGSTLCAVSLSIEMLIVSRVIQAIGTSMFASVGPGMVTTVFPEEERGKGIGQMVMMVSAGFMVGPPLGGWILSAFSWNMIFLINLPVGVFGLFMTQRYFGMLEPPKGRRPFFLGTAVALSLALVSLVFGMNQLSDYALTSYRIWGPWTLSVLAFVAYIWLESKPERALVGLDMFRIKTFSISIGAQLMHFSAMAGVLVLIPFYLERVRNMEPNQVGLFLVILPIMMFLFAPTAGRISDKIGFKLLTSTGMIILGVGLWLLTGLEADSTNWYIIGSLVVVGVGVGMFSTPNSSAMMGSVTRKQRAVASGILATNRNIGMSMGVGLSTALFAYFRQQHVGLGDPSEIFLESYRPVIYVAMGLAAAGLVFCLIRANRPPVQEDAPEAVSSSPAGLNRG